jgi:hypothetical protein
MIRLYQVVADQMITMLTDESDQPSLPERSYSAEQGHLAAELTAAELMSEDDGSGSAAGRQGQMALKTMFRFICYNADWIQVCPNELKIWHMLGIWQYMYLCQKLVYKRIGSLHLEPLSQTFGLLIALHHVLYVIIMHS